MELDNGYYVDDLIIWSRGYCAKGYKIYPPNLQNSSEAQRIELEDRLRTLMTNIPVHGYVQFSWSCDSDYREMLDYYANETETKEMPKWAKINRIERHSRCVRKMQAGELRRQNLIMYVHLPITSDDMIQSSVGEAPTKENIKVMRSIFSNYTFTIKSILGSACPIVEMYENDYYKHHLSFFNPTISKILLDDMPGYDPEKTILENCYRSEVNAHHPQSIEPFSFVMDNHYHNICIMNKWPEFSEMGMINLLTYAGMLDYRITLNIYPYPVDKIINETKSTLKRLNRDFQRDKNNRELLTSIREAEAKIDKLAEGQIRPIKAEFIVHNWSMDEFESKRNFTALRTAIEQMQTATSFLPTLGEQGIHLFAKTIPGATPCNPYDFHRLYADTDFIAPLIPFSASFIGWIKPEAIYDGENGELIGVNTSIGGQVQHASLFGMTGVGKSAMMIDLLTQTAPYADFTAIVEEGASYSVMTEAFGCKPIYIHSEGTITINYFDTLGLPLSPGHKSTVTAFISEFCGSTGVESKDNIRFGQISYFVNQLYQQTINSWKARNPKKAIEAARLAMAVKKFRDELMPEGSSLPEAFTEYLDQRDHLKSKFENADDVELLEYAKDVETEDEVNQYCTIFFNPEDFPTHTKFFNFVTVFDDPLRIDQDSKRDLLALLEPWQSDGPYGPLFDGITNISMRDRIAHFELGQIDESQEQLKKMAAFLIMNFVRKHVMTMPRSSKKQFIFEEAGRIALIPGGQKIISEGYEQMRKYKTWVISIVQAFEKFKGTPIARTIVQNAREFFLLNMGDPADLANLSDVDKGGIALPRITQQRIMGYKKPEDLPPNDRYSTFCYVHRGNPAKIGTCRVYCNREMLYAASSSASDYNQIMRDLKKYVAEGKGDVVDAITHYASL